MDRTILFVDDQQDILNSFKRQLRKKFIIDTASSGIEGLMKIKSAADPYAVIVTDMRMPVMDGIKFLNHAREQSPQSVKVMLTGQADFQTAMDAVNKGHIFRFLTKPCSDELLTDALNTCLEQYELIIAEKELLEQTLSGSVKVLTEILGLVNPIAFGRAQKIKRIVHHIVEKLFITEAWKFELAAMLSQIGCVTLPTETLNKIYAGMPLEKYELQLFREHPAIAKKLLVNIPRIEDIAGMIEAQNGTFKRENTDMYFETEDPILLGGHFIKIATVFDTLVSQGKSLYDILNILLNDPENYVPEIVNTLKSFEMFSVNSTIRPVAIKDLKPGMILHEDLKEKSGMLILVKGQEVTVALLQRLRAFSLTTEIKEPFMVIERQVKI